MAVTTCCDDPAIDDAPRSQELILDFDPTHDPVHGNQQMPFFHGYYDQYHFLPLYVFCGGQLLVAYLRPANIDGAKHGRAILNLLVTRSRRPWPNVRIKEQQLGLFADRTSCHDFVANQFRVLLSAAAYILLDHLRRHASADTELAQTQVETIRLEWLKIGARVVCSVRRVVIHIAEGYPLKDLFARIPFRLRTGSVLSPASG